MKVDLIKLDPKQNRMPVDVPIKKPKFERPPLVQPELMVQNNPAVQRLLEPFKPFTPKQVRAAAKQNIEEMVANVNARIKSMQQFKGIRFDIDARSGRTVAVVRDRKSGEVLKQIPREGLLEIAARLREASGLLVDKQG